MNIQEFIKKLQNLPLYQRKIILWAIVAIVGLTLVFVWWQISKQRLARLETGGFIEQLNLPSFEEQKKEFEQAKEKGQEQLEGVGNDIEELKKELENSNEPEDKELLKELENI